MEDWTAYYTNNPYDDYNLVVEILYKDKDVALIFNGKEGLELKWYANKEDLVIPLEWLMGLLSDANNRLKNI